MQLSTTGCGKGNHNDMLMEKLANDGNGNYAYVDTISQARRVFVEDLTGMLQVIPKENPRYRSTSIPTSTPWTPEKW